MSSLMMSSLRELMLAAGQPAGPDAAVPEALRRPDLHRLGFMERAPLATITHVPRQWLDAGARRARARGSTGHSRAGRGDPGARRQRRARGPGRPDTGRDLRSRPMGCRVLLPGRASRGGLVDGWWKGGDIATLDCEGALRLVDRGKDLVRPGGEWMSSVNLENELIACLGVAEAAVTAAPANAGRIRPVASVMRDITGQRRRAEELAHPTLCEMVAARPLCI